MFLFVGLGNPGKEYEKTRHNVGFMAVDAIIRRFSFSAPKVKFHGEISEGVIDGHKVLALKPTTFMNRSGVSVGEAASFYKISLSNIIVFHDELDLALGKVRVKTGGGAAGHNGLRDIDSRIGKDYRRVRLGIGHPGDKDQVTGYVLQAFAKDEEPVVERMIEAVAEHSLHLIGGDEPLFMTRVSDALKPPSAS